MADQPPPATEQRHRRPPLAAVSEPARGGRCLPLVPARRQAGSPPSCERSRREQQLTDEIEAGPLEHPWAACQAVVVNIQRPVLLVDIDGVLNIYGVDECPEGFSEVELFPGDDEPARLCQIHGEWICELSKHFDVAWASAWGFDAHRLLGPILGLDPFPFVPMPDIPFPPAAKVPAIESFVGERPAAWLDDVMTPEARAWARGRTPATILVEVNHRTGLERGHVDTLLAWVAQLRESSS